MTESTTTLDPRYFELGDIRAVQGRSWIPLRQDLPVDHASPVADIGGVHTYAGIATLAVADDNRATAEALGWSELDVSSHQPDQNDGGYRPVDLHHDWTREHQLVGVRLVIAQDLGTFRRRWDLHPDLVLGLKLERDGDSWFRPDEGWVEVARLQCAEDGNPVLLEISAEMLSDYLAARGMALYLSSYHERAAYFENRPAYSWNDGYEERAEGRDAFEKYVAAADFPPERRFRFRAQGALWRTEWFEPGTLSVRVRGDRQPDDVTFAVGPAGERKSALECVGAMTYLAFKPTLVPALLRYRGGSLGWYSRHTGGLGAATKGIHFGVNSRGLITIFAKDIASLDSWEQRVWAAHSTAMDGGVSPELFDTQMNCKPAETTAPETQVASALAQLNAAFSGRFGEPLLRENDAVDGLLRRVHRFRAVEHDGLFALAKDLNRLFAERVNLDALRKPSGISSQDKLGSLKALERLVAKRDGDEAARAMMAPLFGINDLRQSDAHLGSNLVDSALARAKVDSVQPVERGRQLIQSFIDTIAALTTANSPLGED